MQKIHAGPSLAVLLLGACSFAAPLLAADAPATPAPKAADLFNAQKVWDVSLTFTAEQWKAMEPVQGPRPSRRAGGGFLQGAEGSRNGIASAFGIQYNYVHAQVDFGTWVLEDVGARYKGNGTFLTSRDTLKRSIKLDLNQFKKGQKLAGLHQINLHNSVRDPSNTNETIAYRLFRDCQVPAPRTTFAQVKVTVPGLHDHRYFGLYNVVEDVGGAFLQEHFGTAQGALLKPVTPTLFGYLGEDWKAYNQTYDPKTTLTDGQKRRIIETCKFLSNATDEEFAAKLGDYLDLDNAARYFALTVWMVDLDGILGPGQNYYLHLHPETQKFSFIPWDQDQGFGQFPRGTIEQRIGLSIKKPWTGNNRFLDKLFKAESFRALYLAKLKEFNATVLQPEKLSRQVDELGALLRPAVTAESQERLGGFNKAIAGETLPLVMGPGYREPVPVKPIKAFVGARWKSVDDQLAGRSAGETLAR